jgi:hypothetical protein
MSDVSLANDATYAAMTMRTLAQQARLQAADSPLPDLAELNNGELEQKMLELSGEMSALAAALPPELTKRGFVGRDADDATRAQMSTFRDLKLRLAWTAGTYAVRGGSLRDFAFSRGLQGYLRNWRLPKDKVEGEFGKLPLEWLNEKQRAEYLEMEKARAEKRAARKKKAAEGS